MSPQVGNVVYIDGNRAAVALGPEIGQDGQETGRFYVGLFSTIEVVESGDYGSSPGPAPDRAAIAASQQVGQIPSPSGRPTAPAGIETAEPLQVGATTADPFAAPALDTEGQLKELLTAGVIDQPAYDAAVARLTAERLIGEHAAS